MTRAAVFVLASFATLALWAQPRPARPSATVKVATIDGKPLTAGGVNDLLRNAPQSVLLRLREDPKALLINYTVTHQLAEEAKKAGLDQKFPYKQDLDWQTSGVLMSARLNAMLEAIDIPETEIRDYYTKNIHKYRIMTATSIRVLPDKATGMAGAKARADEVVKQARAGVSFVELGAKYSSEPDLAKPAYANPITPSFDLPTAARDQLFGTLQGQVTNPPIQMIDSYVIFRVETLKATSLSDVRADIRAELQQQRSGAELERVQKGIQAKLLMPQFFAATAPNPLPGAPAADSIDPAAIVAEINGRKITAKELSDTMHGVSPGARQAASQNGEQFLVQFETLRILAGQAREAGLDKKPPASDIIRWSTEQTLMQAQLDEKTKSITNTLKEQEDFYKTNENQFRVAQTKVIYVAYSVSPPPGSPLLNEAQALQKTMDIRRKATAGTDFVQLVKQYSEDDNSKKLNGDMGLRYSDPGLPETVRTAVFNAKAGETIGPVRHTNGFFLFLVKENKVLPFDEVRNDIYNVLSDEKFKTWFESYRNRVEVTIDNEAALRAELAYH